MSKREPYTDPYEAPQVPSQDKTFAPKKISRTGQQEAKDAQIPVPAPDPGPEQQ